MEKTNKKIQKVLILGSGALKIGEAGEFDYSGSQAIKALREEGIRTVLINPNIATIQTSREMADEVYFLPVTPDFVEGVIKKERPDAIFLSFGGQTALNCGIALEKSGVLKKHDVTILGTPINAIILTEDRKKFAGRLRKLGIPTPRSEAARNMNEAIKIAERIGFPAMIRAGFTLGGQGSGVAYSMADLKKIAGRAFAFTPQILIEQYLHHFKEIEYEVVRDSNDNCVTVCNMENFDPLGIHTGDSIVVAPSQTLNNEEYHELRRASIEIVRSLGIIGECNVQFALNPRPQRQQSGLRGGQALLDYYVIEVNARLSRSSALASKATGYPLAYIAAKLGLGYSLTDLNNKVTGVTKAAFEPALDYIVTKIPRFDMDKFEGAESRLGSGMKSVGEVMGIGRTFEESFQKAIRMLDLNYEGVSSLSFESTKEVKENLKNPTPKRMFAVAQAMRSGMKTSEIYKLSGVDPWFLSRIKNIVDHEKDLSKKKKLEGKTLLELKQIGISDKRIGELVGKTGLEIRALRMKLKVLPSVFQIDTLAAEFPAKTNYLYMTYSGSHHDVSPAGKDSVIVLGSGPYHIGSSVEFDWCSVNAVFGLKKHGKKSIIINCNPETVSTDYDISDKLYFEELTFERIADIYDFEEPSGVIVSVGGQTPNNRAKALHKYGAKILGTSPVDIDRAEDRAKFSALLDKFGIKQPAWDTFTTLDKAENFADKVGYPVLIRPSYVLSGSAMKVCTTRLDLEKYLKKASSISREYPVTVSKFFQKAREIELDSVADRGVVRSSIISEHIEYAGVHSGDASIVLPPQDLDKSLQEEIKSIGAKLAKELNITGPFNIQFLLKDDEVYIIELNLRASRTFPFIAKVTGVNMISIFVDVLFGQAKDAKVPETKFVAVKVAQFSYARLTGASTTLGVEMASTGEAACFGDTLEEAYLKGIIATGDRIPKRGVFISVGGDEKKADFLSVAQKIVDLKLPIYATEKTAMYLNKNGIKTKALYKLHENKSPNIIDYFARDKIDLAINIVDPQRREEMDDSYRIGRMAVEGNIALFTKIKTTDLFVTALISHKFSDLKIKAWGEYLV